MKYERTLLLLVLLLQSPFILFGEDEQLDAEKGIAIVETEDRRISDGMTMRPTFAPNVATDFDDVKTNNIVAVLVGIDDYSNAREYPNLSQCRSDVKLLSKLLQVCCKVPSENVIEVVDVTKEAFLLAFREVVGSLDPAQGFLLSYSGHGSKEGGQHQC